MRASVCVRGGVCNEGGGGTGGGKQTLDSSIEHAYRSICKWEQRFGVSFFCTRIYSTSFSSLFFFWVLVVCSKAGSVVCLPKRYHLESGWLWVAEGGRSFFSLQSVLFVKEPKQKKKKDPARGYAFWSAARDFNEESYWLWIWIFQTGLLKPVHNSSENKMRHVYPSYASFSSLMVLFIFYSI